MVPTWLKKFLNGPDLFSSYLAQSSYLVRNIISTFISHVRTRLLNMTWSNLRFNISRSFVTMATNLPSFFSIQFLEQLLKFIVNLTLLKYAKSQRNYGFLITKELIFGFQILNLKDHFSASLSPSSYKIYEDQQIHTKTGSRPIKCQHIRSGLILIECHTIIRIIIKVSCIVPS